MAKQLPPPDTRDAYGYPVYSPSLLREIYHDSELRKQFEDWNYQQRQARIAENYNAQRDAAKPPSTGARLADAGLSTAGALGGAYLARNVLGFGKPMKMPNWLGGANTSTTPAAASSTSATGGAATLHGADATSLAASQVPYTNTDQLNTIRQVSGYPQTTSAATAGGGGYDASAGIPQLGTSSYSPGANVYTADNSSLVSQSGDSASTATGNGLMGDTGSTAAADTANYGIGTFGGQTGYVSSGLQAAGVGPETAGAVGDAYSSAIPYVGPALGAYGAYQQFKKPGQRKGTGGQALTGAASGAAMGSYFGPVGAVVGGVIGGAAGLASSMTASRYAPNKATREGLVDSLKNAKILDENGNVTLSSGASWKFDPTGETPGTGGGKFSWDFGDKAPGGNDTAVGASAALAHALMGGNGNYQDAEALTGWLTNLATSKGDALSNLREFASKSGISWKQMRDAIQAADDLDQPTKDAYHNATDQLWGTGAYANGQNPIAGTPAAGDPNKALLTTPQVQPGVQPGAMPQYSTGQTPNWISQGDASGGVTATEPSTSPGVGSFTPQMTQNMTPGVQITPVQGIAQALSPWPTGRQIWGVTPLR